MLAAAGFCCCVPMAMPQGHLVALCTDLGISASAGAAMLSMLLGLAFLSRQAWGLVADRIGGLRTIFAGSVWQLVAMVGFLATQSEAGLFIVSAVFGLGFSGIIPAYVRGSGIGFGGWLAGACVGTRRFRHFHLVGKSLFKTRKNYPAANSESRGNPRFLPLG